MIKNKKLVGVLASILILSGVLSGCGSKAVNKASSNETAKVIRIGTSGGYYPYTFMNKKNKLDGFEIDVWNEIGKRTGYKPEFVTASFSGLFGMLDAGKIDTIANEITITVKRKDKYLFSNPYVYSGAQIVVKKDNNSIEKLENLKGKKIGVSLGSNYEQIIRNFDKNKEITVVTYEDDGGMRQDLALGRIDALMDDKVSAIATVEEIKYL